MASGLVATLGAQAGGVQMPEQWPSALLDAEELGKEDAEGKKAVYLVTVAALQCSGAQQGNAGLACPSRMDAFANPSYANAGGRARGAPVTCICIFPCM